jgi:hypothetical protein
VVKGTVIAELADISALKTLLPVDRRSVNSGAPLTVQVEGESVAGKVQAVVPLPERFQLLRELATPFAAAWVSLPNGKGELEPGLRVRAVAIPVAPIATIPKRAFKPDAASSPDVGSIQVIRNEYVTNIPVRILGDTTPERTQITGALRATDALIVSASVPLLAGTLIRFGEGAAASRGIEGVAPSPSVAGVEAGITQPGGASQRATGARTPRSTGAPKSASQNTNSNNAPY